jgi:hypothetical protein
MQSISRHTLVTTDERSRHPFLASLPPHVRTGAEAMTVPRRKWLPLDDLRDFLMAYCACFLAVTAYIA